MRRHLTPTLILAACAAWPGHALAQGRPDMRERTAAIAERYLQNWSADDGSAIGNVPYVYGPSIRFYGRNYSQAELSAEKRRAVRLWPVRNYRHRPGSMSVVCNEATARCAARSIIEYRVANPSTGRTARGSAKFDLGVSYAGPRPVILYEDGTRSRGRG